jgi:hypothetical protein
LQGRRDRMLWNASNIVGYGIDASDGRIGGVDDFLIDERAWSVRWLVVNAGGWLTDRRVLLPPAALGEPDAAAKTFPVRLTRRQVKESPDIDLDAPVSRQHEIELARHYQLTPYWTAGYDPVLGVVPPVPPLLHEAAGAKPGIGEMHGDPRLHSMATVVGSYVKALDGEIGHVEELLLDSDDWAVRYVVVDTKNWWPGKKVLLSPRFFHDVDWADRHVRVDLSRQSVKAAPEYDPSRTIDRAFEERLHGHYGVPVYWD